MIGLVTVSMPVKCDLQGPFMVMGVAVVEMFVCCQCENADTTGAPQQ
jgi:hypothetical protein